MIDENQRQSEINAVAELGRLCPIISIPAVSPRTNAIGARASRNCVFDRLNLDILGLNSYISRCWRWCYGPPTEKYIQLHPSAQKVLLSTCHADSMIFEKHNISI